MTNQSNILSTSLRSPVTITLSVVIAACTAMLTEYFFFNPTNQFHIQTLFGEWFQEVFNKRWINASVVFISVVITSVLLFRIDSKHKLIPTKSSLCFAIYIFVFSSNPANLNNTYVPVFNLLGVLAFYSLFDGYNRKKGYMSYIFNIFFIFSFLSLMDFNALLYVPVLLYGINKMRILSGRSLIGIALGLLLPYWFYMFWCYYQGAFDSMLALFSNNFTIDWLDVSQIQPYEWLHLGYTILLSIPVVSQSVRSLTNTRIKTRAFIHFLIVFLLYSLVLIVFNSSFSSMPISFFYMISTFLMARYFSMEITSYKNAIFVFSIFFYLTIFLWSLWLS